MRLEAAGFHAGCLTPHGNSALTDIPHDCGFEVLAEVPTLTEKCAIELTKIVRTFGFEPPVSLPPGLIPWGGNVRVGPRQASLLTSLRDAGYLVPVLSGFRSFYYQTLLFAEQFLAGKAFDEDNRYTVLPPGVSDHQILDGAFDIADIAFELKLALIQPKLPFSLYRPYLTNPTISFEPWHWRCVGAGELEQFPPNDLNKDALEGIIDFLEGGNAKTTWDEYVFVSGFFSADASYCVGSMKGSIPASIADAKIVVGHHWPAYYISICHGYTPLLDNTARPYDIGCCTFRATGLESGHHAYLTGKACAIQGIHTPALVTKELNRKGSFPSRNERFLLKKGVSTDIIFMKRGAVLPARCGLPRALTERQVDLPLLVSSEILEWLERSSSGSLPPYRSIDYAKSVSTVADHSRYCALFLLLERNAGRVRNRCRTLRDRLVSIYRDGAIIRTLMTGSWAEGDEAPASTAVFLAHALAASGNPRAGRALLTAQSGTIRDYLATTAQSDGALDPIFLGHLCHLLYDMEWTDDGTLESCGISVSLLLAAVAYAPSERLLYSLGTSQILRLLLALGYYEAKSLIFQQLDYLIACPEPQVHVERGAFSGLESFQSALPLEALNNLALSCELSHKDLLVVRRRLLSGLSFLRGLQFQQGSNLYGDRLELFEGAIRYSPIDHHFRFDYSLHALSVAWAAEELASI
jgi:hypothetical protein